MWRQREAKPREGCVLSCTVQNQGLWPGFVVPVVQPTYPLSGTPPPLCLTPKPLSPFLSTPFALSLSRCLLTRPEGAGEGARQARAGRRRVRRAGGAMAAGGGPQAGSGGEGAREGQGRDLRLEGMHSPCFNLVLDVLASHVAVARMICKKYVLSTSLNPKLAQSQSRLVVTRGLGKSGVMYCIVLYCMIRGCC